jgi:7,8-dihydropterin-6-yl-methyl-4-(beta-D-ribofuranosyl)aminobenzene 5'-phosphate synthase
MFDTGGEGRRLLSHMEIMGKDPEEIQMVFLSHSHGDHTGGLWELSAHNPGLKVYIPKSFSTGFDEAAVRRGCKVIRIGSPTEISPGVFSTGEMGMWTKEHSLILDAGKGSILLTGCAHPGIMAVIKRTKALFPMEIRLVMGGYHLFSTGQWEIMKVIRSFHESGVERVYPCHCTGEGAVGLFREYYGERCIEGGVGRVIEIF